MDLLELSARHVYTLLFLAVLIDQLGIPFPSPPILLAAGAATASGHVAFVPALALGVLATLAANFFWYEIGRWRGIGVVRTLCRVALERDSCVRRSENLFARRGAAALLISKFVPGLATVAPPLAGVFRMRPGRFLLFDGLASLAWVAAFLWLGLVFSDSLERLLGWVSNGGGALLGLGAACLVIWISAKLVVRAILLRRLRLARISPEELKARLDSGESVILVDLRHPLDFDADPVWIPGAIRLDPERIDEQQEILPRNHEIVLYCSCPNEATSARVALRLRRRGLGRVRPLLGGLDGWRGRGLPVARLDERPGAEALL